MDPLTIDYDLFKWRPDEEVPGRVKRDACAFEIIEAFVWNMIKQGSHHMFLAMNVSLDDTDKAFASNEEFLSACRLAWQALRWEVPAIASSTEYFHPQGQSLPTVRLTYDAVKDLLSLDAWSKEVVQLKEGYTDLMDLRYDLSDAGLLPPDNYLPQTFLYVVPYTASTFGLLLRTAHTPFDGSGVKLVMNLYLRQLDHVKYSCTCYSFSVLPSVVFNRYLQHAHAFKTYKHPDFDVVNGKPKTRALRQVFTLEESEKIRTACKPGGVLEEKITVNQLCRYYSPFYLGSRVLTSVYVTPVHGTFCLLPIIDNPPSSSDGALLFYGLVDARYRLKPPYNQHLAYPGYGLAVSGIVVPLSAVSDSKGNELEMVKACTKIIKSEYEKQRKTSCLLAAATKAARMWLAEGAKAPGPPKPELAPWFSGDGIGSRYLDAEYYCQDGMSKRKILEVNDMFLCSNVTDPGPAGEWGGKITLSVDFNEKAADIEVVQSWMDKWKNLVLTISAVA
ncbi:hypothetical protein DL96DRAFT_1709937 [Flagelloscypha sp. PMI_526]|nr:hypothetical protein DL96DRAFT_1709937 [Flagelloscypha sp. PMI_526]